MSRAVRGLLFVGFVFTMGWLHAQQPWCGPRIEGVSAVMPGVRLALVAACVKLPTDVVFYG